MEAFTASALAHRCGEGSEMEPESTPCGSGAEDEEEEKKKMGLIMTDDIKAMREQVKALSEAATAMRGALIAAENGSDAEAVQTILLDSVEVASGALREIQNMATVQPRQQSLTVQEEADLLEAAAEAAAVVDHRRRRRVEAEGTAP
jgi:hypothetical protein